MSEMKPSYIGLLNAISNGERRGHELLSAWAQKTPNAELRGVLNVVAIREAEHAWAFEKRLCELGYALRPKEDAKHAERMGCAGSAEFTDAQKFDFLGFGRAPDKSQPDGLLSLLADDTMDPQTAGLMGRFIAEERDSGRRLRGACAAVSAATMQPAAQADVLTEICRQLAALHEKVELLSSAGGMRKLEAVRS